MWLKLPHLGGSGGGGISTRRNDFVGLLIEDTEIIMKKGLSYRSIKEERKRAYHHQAQPDQKRPTQLPTSNDNDSDRR